MLQLESFLGNSKNEAANANGEELFKQSNFTAAKEWFHKAYYTCTSGYSDEQTFRGNINHAKAEALNAEGDILLNQKKYTEAIAKYQAAHSKCPSSKTNALNKYKNNEAEALNDWGNNLKDNKKYEDAIVKYKEAIEITTDTAKR
jgi:tetratricopeptide (TPR) repeat protein